MLTIVLKCYIVFKVTNYLVGTSKYLLTLLKNFAKRKPAIKPALMASHKTPLSLLMAERSVFKSVRPIYG
jgi:hypothetical protein